MTVINKTGLLTTLTIGALASIFIFYHVGVSSVAKFDCENLKHLNEIHNARCRFLPDILIVGFDKCGTMTLRQFISVHPDIFITRSSANTKLFKVDYHNDKSLNGSPIKDKKVECTPEGKLRLEKLVSPNIPAPENVHKYVPQVKLIAIVKEPTERVMSTFVHRVNKTKNPWNIDDFDVIIRKLVSSENVIDFNENNSTEEQTKGLFMKSFYATWLKPWVNVFGVDKILILDGDNFVANPVEELRKAEQFIGLEPKIQQSDFHYDEMKKFYCIREEGNTGCMSEKKGRPHPAMSNNTRRLIKDFFKPYNEEFYELIGRRFPWDD